MKLTRQDQVNLLEAINRTTIKGEELETFFNLKIRILNAEIIEKYEETRTKKKRAKVV